MGTNFYIFMRGREHQVDANKYFPNGYILTNSPGFGYEVHLGKISFGWKPLFHGYKNTYTSVKELISLLDEHPSWDIIDEYDDFYTREKFKNEFIDFGENQGPMYLDIDQDMKFTQATKEKHMIETPIDHLKFHEITKSEYNSEYWHDDEGHNFTFRDFC